VSNVPTLDASLARVYQIYGILETYFAEQEFSDSLFAPNACSKSVLVVEREDENVDPRAARIVERN
jgi:hypothetical protein